MEQDREYYLSSLSSHIFSAESVAQSLLSYILISGMHNLLFTLHFPLMPLTASLELTPTEGTR